MARCGVGSARADASPAARASISPVVPTAATTTASSSCSRPCSCTCSIGQRCGYAPTGRQRCRRSTGPRAARSVPVQVRPGWPAVTLFTHTPVTLPVGGTDAPRPRVGRSRPPWGSRRLRQSGPARSALVGERPGPCAGLGCEPWRRHLAGSDGHSVPVATDGVHHSLARRLFMALCPWDHALRGTAPPTSLFSGVVRAARGVSPEDPLPVDG